MQTSKLKSMNLIFDSNNHIFKIKNSTLQDVIYFEFWSLGKKNWDNQKAIMHHRPVFIIYGRGQAPSLGLQ